MATLAQQLTSVQTAIEAVESGIQSITQADGSSLTYPPLDVLYKREARLQAKIDRESKGRVTVAEF